MVRNMFQNIHAGHFCLITFRSCGHLLSADTAHKIFCSLWNAKMFVGSMLEICTGRKNEQPDTLEIHSKNIVQPFKAVENSIDCSMLPTILFSIVTPDRRLIQAQQCWTILSTTLNNVGSKTLFNAVFDCPEQVVRFRLCSINVINPQAYSSVYVLPNNAVHMKNPFRQRITLYILIVFVRCLGHERKTDVSWCWNQGLGDPIVCSSKTMFWGSFEELHSKISEDWAWFWHAYLSSTVLHKIRKKW